MFRKTKLSGVSTAVQQALKNNRAPLVDKMLACVTNRFDDLQTIDAMKGVRLLNFNLWPIDTAALHASGDLEVSLLVNHFKSLLKNEVSLPIEWSTFKHYAAQNFQRNSNIWPLLLTTM